MSDINPTGQPPLDLSAVQADTLVVPPPRASSPPVSPTSINLRRTSRRTSLQDATLIPHPRVATPAPAAQAAADEEAAAERHIITFHEEGTGTGTHTPPEPVVTTSAPSSLSPAAAATSTPASGIGMAPSSASTAPLMPAFLASTRSSSSSTMSTGPIGAVSYPSASPPATTLAPHVLPYAAPLAATGRSTMHNAPDSPRTGQVASVALTPVDGGDKSGVADLMDPTDAAEAGITLTPNPSPPPVDSPRMGSQIAPGADTLVTGTPSLRPRQTSLSVGVSPRMDASPRVGGTSGPPSRRGSRFLTRTHVSYSNIPTAEEKIELAAMGVNVDGSTTPGVRASKTPRLARSQSSAAREKTKLLSFQLNDPDSIRAGNFPSNFIKTSKYTLLTFLPVNLFEQFRRVANLYFAFVVILQTIPGVSPFPIYTSLAPLIFILAIGALNEAREDWLRHRADDIANSRPCILLRPAPTEKSKDAASAGAAEGEQAEGEGLEAGGSKALELPTTSATVSVGDILRIEQGQEFPADLILLHTSREDGTCYVNTANLDGEAAPKVRSASAATQNHYNTPALLVGALKGRIQYEAPNASLYRFQGNVLMGPPPSADGQAHTLPSMPNTPAFVPSTPAVAPTTPAFVPATPQRAAPSTPAVPTSASAAHFGLTPLTLGAPAIPMARSSSTPSASRIGMASTAVPVGSLGSGEVLHPLGDKQLLLRGAKLVNTSYIYGLVVYTGAQTKMMLNRNPARFKFSHFEQQLNRCVFVCLALNIVICLIPSFFYIGNPDLSFPRFWGINKEGGEGWILDFITLYILFSFMVPQSLYVTIELVKVGQAKFMEWDNLMGYTDPETGEYTRCQVKASALNEELGSVDVICTDKTGTLTSNHMELSRCSVGGALFFENDTHRDHHALGNPQAESHRERYGAHKLMGELARVAFGRWINGEGAGLNGGGGNQWGVPNDASAAAGVAAAPVCFDSSDDWVDDSDIPEEELKQNGDRPEGLKPVSKYPSVSATSRDFILNILLCNGALPSWKKMDTNKAANTEGEGAAAEEAKKGGAIGGGNAAAPAMIHQRSASAPVPESNPNSPSPLLPANMADARGHSPQEASPADANAAGSLAIPISSEPLSPTSTAVAASAARVALERQDKRLIFESQSPDEIALLQAAQRVGACFTQRSGNKLTIELDLPAAPAAAPAGSGMADAVSPRGAEVGSSGGGHYRVGSEGSTLEPLSPPLSPDPCFDSPPGSLEPRDVPSGPVRATLTYTVLAELEFASAWRRNSVVVRGPDGSLKLYTKGADTTVAALVDHRDPRQQELLQLVMEQATEFAATGSRTLVFACKPLTEEEFAAWWPLYDAAQNAFHERDRAIMRAFQSLEKDMLLLGCSAVDDQLQEMVPQTVDFLLAASLKIIVLTGDKLETAVTIARQAHLVSQNDHVLYLSGTSESEVGKGLDRLIKEMEEVKRKHRDMAEASAPLALAASKVGVVGDVENGTGSGDVTGRGRGESTLTNENTAGPGALCSIKKIGTDPLIPDPRGSVLGDDGVIGGGAAGGVPGTAGSKDRAGRKIGFALASDGVSLELALGPKHRAAFLRIFDVIETIVSYRSTPMQKALVVALMKETGKTCLAIGDGANDVSMIQEAHVGIGILGKEGAHAAMSSDFVIKRFHHLRRLICVHGRFSYWRTCQVVMFSFYKNLAFPLPLFWYCFYSMANGTTSYDSLLITCFNTFFTSLPPFFAGLFDRDVDESTLMQSPWAFDAFKRQSPFTVRSFVYTLLTATYQSVVFYFIAHFMFAGDDVIRSDGGPGDMAVMGNLMLTGVVITSNLTMLLALSSINYVNILAMAIGFALYAAVFIFMSVEYQVDLSPDGYGLGSAIFGAASSWLYLFYVLMLCLLPNAAYEAWMKMYRPRVYQELQHIPAEVIAATVAREQKGIADAQKAKEAAAKAASVAVAASKGRRRAGRIFSNLTQMSSRSLNEKQAADAEAAGSPKKIASPQQQQEEAAALASVPELPADAMPPAVAPSTHYTYARPAAPYSPPSRAIGALPTIHDDDDAPITPPQEQAPAAAAHATPELAPAPVPLRIDISEPEARGPAQP